MAKYGLDPNAGQEIKIVRRASAAVAAGLAAVVLLTAACDPGNSSTTLSGTHTLTYTVTGAGTIDAPVSLTYGDPAARSFASVSITAVPWSKTYTEQNQDTAYGRLTVDNKNNDTPVHCSVTGDGKSLVEKDIPAGQSVDCAVLHF